MDEERERLYVADNHCIRMIRVSDGYVSTVVGKSEVRGYVDGVGSEVRFGIVMSVVLVSVYGSGDSCGRQPRQLVIPRGRCRQGRRPRRKDIRHPRHSQGGSALGDA